MAELDPEDIALLEDIGRFAHDPLGFACYAFPWGEPNTQLTEDRLEEWQVEVLGEIGEKLRSGAMGVGQAVAEVIQIARCSGKGIGKSALIAIIILWAMSTFEDTRGRITANTAPQLRTISWAELSKWHKLCICGHWFELTGSALQAKHAPNTWRLDALPWNEINPEAFAGLHNKGKRLVIIFDEASAIPDAIWEAIESTLTDAGTEMIWIAFGNPTRNTGYFRDIFRSADARFEGWSAKSIDSRSVSIPNKARIARQIKAYGEDSDYVRVFIKGEFPRRDDLQFIGADVVDAAIEREAQSAISDALVLGCDIGRQNDPSVLYPRKGRDARTFPVIELRIADTRVIATRIVAELKTKPYDACFIDVGGIGWGVYDNVMSMNPPCTIFAVDFGALPDWNIDPESEARYLNKRAQIWGNMKFWLRGGAIPKDTELREELVGLLYDHTPRGEIFMERKKDFKDRLKRSPNMSDALATTFAFPVSGKAGAREVDQYGLFVPAVGAHDTMHENFSRDVMAERWQG